MDDLGETVERKGWSGTAWFAVPPALLATVVATWSGLVAVFSLVVRQAAYEYYGHLDMTPEQVELGYAASISTAAASVGAVVVLLVVWVSFAVVVYRLTAPFRAGLRTGEGVRVPAQSAALVLVTAAITTAVPILLLWLVARGPGARLLAHGFPAAAGNAVLVAGILSAGAVGAGVRSGRVVAFCREQFSKVRGVVAVCLLLAVALAWATNYWAAADEAGRVVRSEGRLSKSKFGYLNVTVAPARVIPKTGDPLGVCDGWRRAVLVGRGERGAYVLLLPADADGPSEVALLESADYGVLTTTAEHEPCNPKAP